MTDSKARPADAVAVHAATQWSLGKNDNERVNRSAAVIAGYASEVRAEAEAAGYQRAVREILTLLEEESDSWAYAQHQLLPHGQGSQDECNRLLKLIRRRFGDGSKGDD